MLSERWALIAQQELGETQERVRSGVSKLRQLTEEHGLNYNDISNDDFLLRFLRARKFKTDEAYKMLEQYCEMRRRFPAPVSQAVLLSVFSQHLSCVLPDTDQLGRAVLVFRAGKWDPSLCSVWDIFQTNLACLELMSRDPVTQVCGVVALVDMADLGLRQARHFTPNYARDVIALLQNCFPLRFKAIHILNEPRVFYLIYSIVKPFLTEKLTKRLYLHGKDVSSVYRHIPRDILPRDYGGPREPFSSSRTSTALQSMCNKD